MAGFGRMVTVGVGTLAVAASLAWAQGVGDLAPNLPPLPEPPALERYLFETPWPTAILIALGAVAVAYALNRSGKGRPAAWTALGGLLVAAGVVITGLVVTTDRERVADACRELVDATAAIAPERLDLILHPDVRATTRFGSAHGSGPVVDFVRRRLPGAGISSARVLEVNAALTAGDLATTQVRVRVESDVAPPNSWWRVDWQRDASADPEDPAHGWRATRIEPLWILGVPNPGG